MVRILGYFKNKLKLSEQMIPKHNIKFLTTLCENLIIDDYYYELYNIINYGYHSVFQKYHFSNKKL
jgi:hypothetical protein